jgi:drug/metabolite transporter (DMT)-like permease
MSSTPAPVDLRAGLLVTMLACLWGGNIVAIKLGLPDAPPIRQAWLRFILGGLTVYAWARWSGISLRIAREEIRPLAVLGVLFTVQIALMNLSVRHTTAGHVAILLNAYPIYTVLLAHVFVPGDRLVGSRLLGVLVAYGGIVLLFSSGLGLGADTLLGDAFASGSALLLGARTIYLSRAVQRIEPVKLLLAQAICSVPIYFTWSSLWEPEPTRWTLSLLLSLLYQGAVVAGFNFLLNLHLLKVYSPSGLAAFYLTTPLFGVAQSWLILGETITLRLLLSAGLVVGGVALASRRPPLRPVPPGTPPGS